MEYLAAGDPTRRIRNRATFCNAFVGAETLSACCRELEALAREGRMDEARAVFERVCHAQASAVAQLQELVREML